MFFIYFIANFAQAAPVFLDGTPVQEFCIYHLYGKDLNLWTDSQQFVLWKLRVSEHTTKVTYEECMSKQYHHRVYMDWLQRIGSQVLNSSIYWNFTLKPSLDYPLIEVPTNLTVNLTLEGPSFNLSASKLQKDVDYFISLFINSEPVKHVQVRIVTAQPTLAPFFGVQLKNLLLKNENITLQSPQVYDWTIFLEQPTRFQAISTTFTVKNSSEVKLFLMPTWSDRVYTVTVLLQDPNKKGPQYYQAAWIHQKGDQWRNTNEILNCSYAYLLNSTFQERQECLEWHSKDLKVLLPNYRYIMRAESLGLNQPSNCNNGSQVFAFQPKRFCLCPENYTGSRCEILKYQNGTVNQFLGQVFLDLQNKTLVNNTNYQRLLFLLLTSYDHYDMELFELFINSSQTGPLLQFLIMYDLFATKSILNNNSLLAKQIHSQLIQNLSSSFMIGLVEFAQFSVIGMSVSQLDVDPTNETALKLKYKSAHEKVETVCTYLNSISLQANKTRSFEYAQMVKYSAAFSAQINDQAVSPFIDCLAFSDRLNSENKLNKVPNIGLNLTIPLSKPLDQIKEKTKQACGTPSVKCRLLRLTQDYAEVDSRILAGPYVIQPSLVKKSFDYNSILQSILKPNHANILMITIVLILI